MAPRKTSPATRVAPKKQPSAIPKATRRPRAVKPAPSPAIEPGPTSAARSADPASAAPTAEQIRLRAYFLHLEHRGRPADPVADWFRAERELTGAARES